MTASANDTNVPAAVAEPRTPTSTPASGSASPGVAPAHQCRQCRASFCQPLGCGHVYCDECAGPRHECPECNRHPVVSPKPSTEVSKILPPFAPCINSLLTKGFPLLLKKPPKTTYPPEDGLFDLVFQKRIDSRIRTIYYVSLCSFWASVLAGILCIIALILETSKRST
ncbi:hypothetical protein CaCOL14_006187 [Colletotrichum acutatum]|uniref:RING-type domain-containing protein n=1 Tax=Glomerella acutata TaxID=27357 RepID=A0AAD8UIS9_GLOAC|nr:uncharacterized protein BDZ83DRAFT_783371 [Colletotrichum acutatum]KAK1722494.1 hypothetical protein BDZ83DRAFT_783371 [Colletotrichum acutatum]